MCIKTPLSTGVCEIKTHLDGAGVLNVPTSLPLFQSWRKDAQQQLTTMSVYFTDRLHSPCACAWTLTLGGMGGDRHWPQVGGVFISQTPVINFHNQTKNTYKHMYGQSAFQEGTGSVRFVSLPDFSSVCFTDNGGSRARLPARSATN